MPSRQRDTQTTQIRVYKYGLVIKGYLPQKKAIDELYKTNKLWNRLVELHNENWQEIEGARCAASDEYQSLFNAAKAIEGQIDEAHKKRRGIRNKTNSSKGNNPETKEVDKRINMLKQQRDCKWKAMNELRPQLQKLIDEKALNKKRNNQYKEAVRVD